MNSAPVAGLDTFPWADAAWMKERSRFVRGEAIRVYQVLLESWRRTGQEATGQMTWREAASALADYARDTGFTHVQLQAPPSSELPSSLAIGAQSEADLMWFIDHLHQRGLGVIVESSALACTATESEPGVAAWCRRFHVDGVYVASMDPPAGRLAAGGMARCLESLRTTWPDILTIADEECSAVEGVAFVCCTEWMRRLVDYLSLDPLYRSSHHAQITQDLAPSPPARWIWPLSPLAVGSAEGLIDRMFGDTWGRLANLRTLFGYACGRTGDVLWLMGTEFGQGGSWRRGDSLDWHLLDAPGHAGLRHWVGDLNAFARDTSCLAATGRTTFEWVDTADASQSVVSFLRQSAQPGSSVLFVCNFTPVPRHNYRVGVPRAGTWLERLNSDAVAYGGTGHGNLGGAVATPVSWHGRPFSLNLTLPPLSVLALCHQASGVSR